MPVTECRRCPGCTGRNGPCARDRVVNVLDHNPSVNPGALPEVQDGIVNTNSITGLGEANSTVVYCFQGAESSFEAGKAIVRNGRS